MIHGVETDKSGFLSVLDHRNPHVFEQHQLPAFGQDVAAVEGGGDGADFEELEDFFQVEDHVVGVAVARAERRFCRFLVALAADLNFGAAEMTVRGGGKKMKELHFFCSEDGRNVLVPDAENGFAREHRVAAFFPDPAGHQNYNPYQQQIVDIVHERLDRARFGPGRDRVTHQHDPLGIQNGENETGGAQRAERAFLYRGTRRSPEVKQKNSRQTENILEGRGKKIAVDVNAARNGQAGQDEPGADE